MTRQGDTRIRHALVTGGSAGLGLAVARCCARRGAAVTIVGRDASRLDRAADELRGVADGAVETAPADLARPGECRRVVELADAAAPVDFVCHAAGRSTRARLVDTTPEQHAELMALNYLAAAELAAAAGARLAERRGHLVLVGSLASRVAPPWMGGYPASKHAVAALAQQLRMELGPAGLHTLLVCPGPMKRDDAGRRYNAESADLPESARRPAGGARVAAIDPDRLAERILRACDRREAEVVTPLKARLLFAVSQLSPGWGDWLLRRKMGG